MFLLYNGRKSKAPGYIARGAALVWCPVLWITSGGLWLACPILSAGVLVVGALADLLAAVL